MPPSIVLEVLKILEAEINLREETRVTEQAKPALEPQQYSQQARDLDQQQSEIRTRVIQIGEQMAGLPKGSSNFAAEIDLMNSVAQVMKDAESLLKVPDTGSPTIAAETEAIELLLKSARFNPKGGGGGGAMPGSGQSGDTADAALALLGRGTNEKEVREDRDVSQTTGTKSSALPEEFRKGLDEYFNRLERGNNP